jgi:peptidoglycan hydrolase-like protein with peptidoglycan-binding domain
MAIERQGRGAWPSDGRGGTRKNPTTPGKHYLLAQGFDTVGIAAVLRFLDGQAIPLDELAVNKGVLAIQRLVNACEGVSAKVPEDGLFGAKTDAGVREVQRLGSVPADGVVGPTTMKTLLLLPIMKAAAGRWQAVYGLLQNEGGWDPGAVGYIDSNDLGLAQVNLIAHPTVTVEQAFDPFWAIGFINGYLANAEKYLAGNARDSILSYNLGIGGTRQWIAAGRPRLWTPPWSKVERDTTAYVDRILAAHTT